MDISGAMIRFEQSLSAQVTLAGPEAEALADAMLEASRPALENMALELVQQAAEQIAAQLPDTEVDVTLREGEPQLVVRQLGHDEPTFKAEDLEARITLRLPTALKEAIESAADDAASSVNTYVVHALSSSARKRGRTRRVVGTVRT